jgi:peptide/nickel transport system permease protein
MRVVRTVGQRLVHLVLVLLLVSIGTFMLLELTPGDPGIAILGLQSTKQAVQQVDHQLGMDRPVLTRYGHWLSGAVRGDLGKSFVPPGGTVAGRIKQALPISAELAILAELMALTVAIPVAVVSAYREGGTFDRIASGMSFGLFSVPTFVSGLVLALLFALEWHLLPRVEWVRLTSTQGILANLSHAFLPALTLALPLMAADIRLLRTDLIQTLREDFVVVARAKGLSVRYVLFRHALRPSSFSLLTLAGVSLGGLIGGTALVEVIYGLPGVGQMLVTAVSDHDYALVQGTVLVVAVIYVLVNATVDVLYLVLDPRTRVHS